MKSIVLLSVLLIFINFNIFAQKIEQELKQIEDTITVDNLISIGIDNYKSPNTAAKYFTGAEKIASKIGYRKGLANSLYHSGINCKNQNKLDSAFFYFNSSLFINRRLDNKKGITLNLLELALYNQYIGDYAEAVRNYFRTLDILLEHPNNKTLGITYHNLGSLYLELNKNKEALNYSLKAFEIEKEFNDSVTLGNSLVNMGQIYFNIDSLKLADSFFEQSLQLNKLLDKKLNIADSYLGIARLLDNKQKFTTALDYYQKAIDIFSLLNNDHKLAWANYYLGNHLYSTGKIEQAIEANEKANQLSKESIDLNLKKKIYFKLQGLYTKVENYEKALLYTNLLSKVENKLKIPETLQYLAISEAELTFKLKEEKTRLEHEAVLKKQKNFKYIFLSSSIFILIILFLISIVLREKSQHNNLLKKANDTRDKMFRLIAHDFRSPLISISNTVHLIPFKIKKQDYDGVTDLCTNVTHSVNRVLALIDNLINWALSQHDNIPYNPEESNLKEISEEITEIYKPIAAYKNIDLQNNISDKIEIFADHNILNTVLRNLINNAIKFTPDNGLIVLNAEAKNNQIEVSIKDTGIGIPEDKLEAIFEVDKVKGEGTQGEKGNGLGLFFCKEFVHKNKGEIWVESTPKIGSTFYFTLPKS
jgi:signal transduction histidine kinase